MLAFHNEHIASCAFLTYFTPDSTTASTSPTALTTAAAATILNDKQALTGILMKPKTFTNLTRRLHPYDVAREKGGGGSALKYFHAPLLQPFNCQSHQHLHQLPLYQHHPHLHHHHHHHHHPHRYRVLKDYIPNAQQMSSLILNVNNSKNLYQDEQHQFVLNRTTLAPTTTTSLTTTTTTTSTATAATIASVTAYKQQQHQCSHDYVQFNRNLSKL